MAAPGPTGEMNLSAGRGTPWYRPEKLEEEAGETRVSDNKRQMNFAPKKVHLFGAKVSRLKPCTRATYDSTDVFPPTTHIKENFTKTKLFL